AGNVTRIQTHEKAVTEEVLVYGPGNRLLQRGTTRYEYDAEGRRIAKTEAADGDCPKVWRYEWNALDQLKKVTRPDGEIWRYKYDGLARRIEKAGPIEKRHFLWDGNVIFHELASSGQVVAWITTRGTFSPLA